MSRALIAFALAAALGACGSAPEPAKSDADAQKEQADARARAEQGVAGEQLKALDKAKGVQGTVDQQADALRQQVEQQGGDAPATAPASTP